MSMVEFHRQYDRIDTFYSYLYDLKVEQNWLGKHQTPEPVKKKEICFLLNRQ